MLPFTPTQISAVAFAFALAAHAQVCPQCPDTDNIGRPVAGNTPLVPGAATADKHAAMISCGSNLLPSPQGDLIFDGSGFCPQNFIQNHLIQVIYTAGGRQDVTDNKLLRAESGRQLAPLQVRKGVKNLVFLLQNYSHKKKIAQYEG
ncbi:hypothetical protein B0H13DRAFT_1870324 [Mycena leptocephala]|nr:hypothetical protein B0H13DRAFT_1870324 [Mycena leptocephala]